MHRAKGILARPPAVHRCTRLYHLGESVAKGLTCRLAVPDIRTNAEIVRLENRIGEV
jgi:hypothetical protein